MSVMLRTERVTDVRMDSRVLAPEPVVWWQISLVFSLLWDEDGGGEVGDGREELCSFWNSWQRSSLEFLCRRVCASRGIAAMVVVYLVFMLLAEDTNGVQAGLHLSLAWVAVCYVFG